MKISQIFFLYVTLFINRGAAILLNGVWNVNVENFDKVFTGSVPGGIYTDLFNANLIPDTFKEDNDVNNRWIGNRSVIYSRQFEIDKNTLEAPKVLLIFEGLDTFATILINDHEIGKTSNMFLRYIYDVKNYIKVGRNHLNVTFSSAVKVAEKLYEKQSMFYEVLPQCVPKQYNGECHVNHIRKAQASFGWDWGPAIPSMGIWKDVKLEPVFDVIIIESSVDVLDFEESWKLDVTFVFGVGSKISNNLIPVTLCLKLEIDELENLETSKDIFVNADKNLVTDSLTLIVPKGKVELWWPNGYGEQKLYKLAIGMETSINHVELEKRVGFRKIELIQEDLVKGRTFYFKVNNVPIFAKGSNWIPASLFPELSSRTNLVQHLLSSSKDVHMNMMRVWGGGYYESDLFYDLADEYGIMIWQDFMFACSMYPTTTEFLDSVREEVRQNVQRLKHHPSIVIWAGNNENEAALYGNWYGTGNAEIYKKDYIKLYVDVIKKEVEKLDSSRPFVVSSPSDGSWTDENGFIGPDPYSKIYGDVHYYNYLGNGWNINQYPITRFMSEYGFQSIPSMDTLQSATNVIDDLKLDSEFLEHRQHLPAGWSFMKMLISKNLEIPQSNDSHRDFRDYIYLSQINQAVSMKIQTEAYRQLRSSLNKLGEGYTRGALYWQLNDVWQAPSWSSIDFAGRWKMLHYFVKDFFAPIIVSPRLSYANDLTIYIVSDKLSSISGCVLNINVYKWNSSQPADTMNFTNITILANSAQTVGTFWLRDLLARASCGIDSEAKKNCFLELVLQDEKGKSIAPINYVYPVPLKDVTLPKANIEVVANPALIPGKLANYLDLEFEVEAKGNSFFVWLEFPQNLGRFSENGFHLLGTRKTIVYHSNSAITPAEFFAGLKVTTLFQLYDPNR